MDSPTRRYWQDQRYNLLSTADYSAGDPVGMAYQLGNHCQATRIARRLGDRRLISNMFDIWSPGGMALKEYDTTRSSGGLESAKEM